MVPTGHEAVPKQSHAPCALQPGARAEEQSWPELQACGQVSHTQVRLTESQLKPGRQSVCWSHSAQRPPEQIRDAHWLLPVQALPFGIHGVHTPALQ